jgi:hypothetical protein
MIHITDLLKPTITCPPPATISCESSVLPAVTGTATAVDNCTPQANVVINYIDDLSGLFGCNHGVLKRTWTAAFAKYNILHSANLDRRYHTSGHHLPG